MNLDNIYEMLHRIDLNLVCVNISILLISVNLYDLKKELKELNKFFKNMNEVAEKVQTEEIKDKLKNGSFIKHCSNCEYTDLDANKEPCLSCRNESNWDFGK